VGKTYAMLAEGRRREEEGERVIVGWIERHGRAETRAQLGSLEVIAPREVAHRGVVLADLDVEGVLASGADLVLVDELAHSALDSNRDRWEDVADILTAGLSVLTTTNVANLHSVRDYAASITSVGVVESVPDEFVRSGEVILIEMPPEALRPRIAAGRVYSADLVGGALAEYFRVSNLEALSELGRAWIDGAVEDVGADLLVRRGLASPAERNLVVAGVSGSQHSERVIRTAAQLARDDDADLLVVHVDVADGASRRRTRELERARNLTSQLGGTFREIQGSAPARELADLARSRRASRVVIARRRSRMPMPTRLAVASRLRRLLPEVTVDEVPAASA
jgi:two-component system sensor histidine kinase KdpD